MPDRTRISWVCRVCGYVHRGERPPDACPVCGAGPEDFEEQLPAPAAPPASRWVCLACGYACEGAGPPENCPVCGAPAERFEPERNAPPPNSAGGRPSRVVVVGAGVAGVSAAESVARSAPRARVTLVNGEPTPPYYRLSLTRYLAGEIGRDALPIHPESWYAKRRIDLRNDLRMTRLDPGNRAAELSDGSRVAGDALILATGAHAFVPPIPGADLDGVFVLRTLADADALLGRAESRPACAVVGGGILGMETAAALARRGVPVTLVESHPWLMPRQLNAEASARIERHVAGLGVRVLKNTRTAEFEGDAAVERIRFEDGPPRSCQLVVLAAGARPNTAAVRKAGLRVDQGIVVDSRLGCGPGLFAAGDAAEYRGTVYGTWGPAQGQGGIAGLNAAGIPSEFGGVPRSNTLKVLGLDLFSIGRFESADGADRVVSDAAADGYAHFVFRDGRMAGAILLGHANLAGAVRRAVESGMDCSAMLRQTPSFGDVAQFLGQKS